MDGEHTVKELVIEYYLRHEVLALPRIAGLVRLLKVHGMLAERNLDAYDELHRRLHRRTAGDVVATVWKGLLQTSIPIPGLDRFFDWLYRSGGWIFFTRPAAVIGVVLLVAGPAFFLAGLASNGYPLFKFGNSYLVGFLLLLFLDLVTISIHECGHALAMKYAGRFVRQSGVMLYYGMPAAYVDTTDAWMAPRKMRLLVSFAGPGRGLIGGITGRPPMDPAFSPGIRGAGRQPLHSPIARLDGYTAGDRWKPMLRGRSFAFVRNELWGRLRTRQPLSPEERFLAFFGLASWRGR